MTNIPRPDYYLNDIAFLINLGFLIVIFFGTIAFFVIRNILKKERNKMTKYEKEIKYNQKIAMSGFKINPKILANKTTTKNVEKGKSE